MLDYLRAAVGGRRATAQRGPTIAEYGVLAAGIIALLVGIAFLLAS
jgi:hypothetical protein